MDEFHKAYEGIPERTSGGILKEFAEFTEVTPGGISKAFPQESSKLFILGI